MSSHDLNNFFFGGIGTFQPSFLITLLSAIFDSSAAFNIGEGAILLGELVWEDRHPTKQSKNSKIL